MTLGSVAYGVTFAACLVATGLSLVSRLWPPALAVGRWTTVVAAVSSTIGLALRWAEIGHPPIFGTFENTYMLTWALCCSSAVVSFAYPRARGVWRWAVPWALASMLWGARFRSETVPLTISEQSLWVDVHVVFAWIALLTLLAASTMSIIRYCGNAPLGLSREEADVTLTNLMFTGFTAFTAMLVTGAWYLNILFGYFWKWEVVGTLSVVAWVGYALVIHGRLFYRWGGRKLDLGVALLLPVLLAVYFIWSVFPGTYHFFDIPLVKPY